MDDIFSLIPQDSSSEKKSDNKSMVPTYGDDSLSDIMIGMSQILQRVAGEISDVKKSNVSVSETVATMDGKVKELADDVSDLKDNQYLEPWQDANVKRAANIRVSDLLGIKWIKGGVAEECMYDYKTYYGKFCRALHGDAKKAGLEGPKMYQTQRKNYAKLIEFIGEWVPIRGVDGQKEYYDKLAECK